MIKIRTFSVESIQLPLAIFCYQKITQAPLASDRGRGFTLLNMSYLTH